MSPSGKRTPEEALAIALAAQYGLTRTDAMEGQWGAKDESERRVWRANAKLLLTRLRALGVHVNVKSV